MSAFLISPSVSVAAGSKTVSLTGSINASFVAPGTAVVIVASDGTHFNFAEGVSGTAADVNGNSTITLRNNWAYPTVTAGQLTAFNTIEGLRDAIRRAREIADDATALTAVFADVFTSLDETIDIDVNGVTVTVTPYQYLTQQSLLLIGQLEDAATLFAGLQTAVQDLTADVAAQQSIVDQNLQTAITAASDASSSAAAAEDSEGVAIAAATAAGNSETVATNKAAEATAAAVAAESSETVATTKAAEASTSASAAGNSESVATNKAAEATAAATAAGNSETVATTKANEAQASATAAGNSETIATDKAAEATAAATAAGNSETVATDKATLAQAWAENPLNTEVQAGQYSAKHHALKAEEWAVIAQAAAGTVTGSLSFNGDYSAAANAWPPVPENGSALYRVSAAGNPGGTALVAGDFIIYDPTLAVWIKWQRPVAISEVAGLELRLSGIESDVSNKANSTDLSDLESVVTGNSSAISSATGRLTTVEQGLDDLEQTVADLEQSTVTPAQLTYVKTLALAGL
jgi:chemotaxis protein histidine kinase CheA